MSQPHCFGLEIIVNGDSTNIVHVSTYQPHPPPKLLTLLTLPYSMGPQINLLYLEIMPLDELGNMSSLLSLSTKAIKAGIVSAITNVTFFNGSCAELGE